MPSKYQYTHFHTPLSIQEGILEFADDPRALDDLYIEQRTRRRLPGEVVLAMGQALRDQGFTVVPACDNHDEKGLCLGHPVPMEVPATTGEPADHLQAYANYVIDAVHDFEKAYLSVQRLQAANLDALSITAARARLKEATAALALDFETFAARQQVAQDLDAAMRLPVKDATAAA